MRLLRMVESLILGAIVSVILLPAVGCRHEVPGVIHVDATAQFTYPILLKGQVLRWKGSTAFTIVWIGGVSPCKGKAPYINSTRDDKVERVTCVVETPPTAGHFYSYRVDPDQKGPHVLDGVRPCPGCTFYSGDSNYLAAMKIASPAGSLPISVFCGGTPASGGISPIPPTQLTGTQLTWNSLEGVDIDHIDFPDGSGVSCGKSPDGHSCKFTQPVVAPLTYTLYATGTAPLYCGLNTASGKTDSTVTK
jgi:hypothetical protein